MKNQIKQLLALFLAFSVTLGFLAIFESPTFAQNYSTEQELSASLPLDEYPIGSYFTKNGKRCTCHSYNNCIPSGKSCNCMRFWPTGNSYDCEIDLLGVQCIGFARFCQYRLFGYIDYGDTADRFTNLLGGRLKAWSWSAADAEYYIKNAGVGGHIRISTHSIIILEVRDEGFVTYECNGKIYGSECLVFSRYFTWESFYEAYGGTAWRYLNIPKEYPAPPTITPSTTAPETTSTPTSPVPETTEAPVTTAPITTAVTTALPPVTANPNAPEQTPPLPSPPIYPENPDRTEEKKPARFDKTVGIDPVKSFRRLGVCMPLSFRQKIRKLTEKVTFLP